MALSTLRRCVLALSVLLPACSAPAAKLWNLEQLHDGTSRHRYTAALESETEYFWRHEVMGMLQGAGVALANKDAAPIEDPAHECLSNLLDLEGYALDRAGLPDPRHVEWFARLAVEDAAVLSRERAVLALGLVGERLPVGLPARLGADLTPAGPEALAPAIEALVRAVRGLIEEKPGADAALAQACDGVRALDLDLAAGRRALRAASELVRLLPERDERATPLRALSGQLQGLCVRRALAVALEDDAGTVRAAALHAVERCAGDRAVDVVLFDRLRKETDTAALVALCEILARHGLPEAGPDQAAPAHGAESWNASLYTLCQRHPDGRVRVAAMRTLETVAHAGVHSLREEDWQAWWLARAASAAQPGSGP